MKKINTQYLILEANLFKETINSTGEKQTEKIIALSQMALEIANEDERQKLLISIRTHECFSTFGNYADNLEQIDGLLNILDDDNEDKAWIEEQLENDFEKFMNFDNAETAGEAIERYYEFTMLLRTKSLDQYIVNQIIFLSPPLEKEYIELYAEELGIVFPKAYVDFISSYGFFEFGTGWVESNKMIAVDKLKEENIVEDLSIPFELSEDMFYDYEVKAFDNGIIVFKSPEDTYRVYEIGFFLRNYNNKNGELLFINGDHDGFEEYETFDLYIQDMINARIRNSLDVR